MTTITNNNNTRSINLEIHQATAGRGRVTVCAMSNDSTIHVDTFDLTNERARSRFLRDTARCAGAAGAEFNEDRARQAILDYILSNRNPNANCVPSHPARHDADHILSTLGLEVLGENDDQTILCWVPSTGKRWVVKSPARWPVAEMIQALGEVAVRHIWAEDGAAPDGMFTPTDVCKAVALAASRAPRISVTAVIGQGIWKHDNGFLIVNGADAYCYNGVTSEQVTHPRLGRNIIDFNPERRWSDNIIRQVLAMSDAAAHELLYRLRQLAGQWNWTHDADPDVVAGLVPATFVQACWTWRPLVTITGQSDSGKSTLFSEVLRPIFGDWTVAADVSTAAGLRQAIGCNACPVLIDEFDKYAQRQQVLELFRTASRGGQVLRGTRDQTGRQYGLRHLAWFAAIESGEIWAQDRNRRIRLEINVPRNRGVVNIPGPTELKQFGQGLAAAALWALPAAITLADTIKSTRIEGVQGRFVECFSVPAAMYTVLESGRQASAVAAEEVLRRMIVGRDAITAQREPDQLLLLRDILQTNTRVNVRHDGELRSEERAIGQLLTSRNPEEEIQLEAKGIRIFNPRSETHRQCPRERRLFLDHQAVHRLLLKGTRWEGLGQIDQLLMRITGATRDQQRCGGFRRSGVSLPWATCLELLNGQDTGEDNESS